MYLEEHSLVRQSNSRIFYYSTITDFTVERPEGFHALSLIKKAIPQCGATITKASFEINCAW